jgi:hypothetical protein
MAADNLLIEMKWEICTLDYMNHLKNKYIHYVGDFFYIFYFSLFFDREKPYILSSRISNRNCSHYPEEW